MTGEAIALANPWEQIKAGLTTRISAGPTKTGLPERHLKVRKADPSGDGPDQVTKQWMEQEYAEAHPRSHSRAELAGGAGNLYGLRISCKRYRREPARKCSGVCFAHHAS